MIRNRQEKSYKRNHIGSYENFPMDNDTKIKSKNQGQILNSIIVKMEPKLNP